MERKPIDAVKGFKTIDGAGVHLVRVLGYTTRNKYDPILMLDSFDSTNPDDYLNGFPFHPHRGIETITYIKSGAMTHRDNLGNSDTIQNGEVQWMTAGSGMLHEEMPQTADRMLGVQLWLNLPQKDKMCRPTYVSLRKDDIPRVAEEGARIDVISGSYKDTEGHQGEYQPLDYYHVELDAGANLELPTDPEAQVILFTLEGDTTIGGELIEEKTAVRTTPGDCVILQAEKPASVLFLQSFELNEPIAWGGPIVMNTREEMQLAFKEFEEGTFIKEHPDVAQ